jgi:hypothetical protein
MIKIHSPKRKFFTENEKLVYFGEAISKNSTCEIGGKVPVS